MAKKVPATIVAYAGRKGLKAFRMSPGFANCARKSIFRTFLHTKQLGHITAALSGM